MHLSWSKSSKNSLARNNWRLLEFTVQNAKTIERKKWCLQLVGVCWKSLRRVCLKALSLVNRKKISEKKSRTDHRLTREISAVISTCCQVSKAHQWWFLQPPSVSHFPFPFISFFLLPPSSSPLHPQNPQNPLKNHHWGTSWWSVILRWCRVPAQKGLFQCYFLYP